ncbi:MAG: hypothetical protein ABGZ35_23000 [Planctomycetaceae bacterium]
MKGPSLQHELVVLRIWKCPACGRSVRTGGEVTARTCDCNDQAQMEYSDAIPLAAPDVSAFVTYLAPEYLDDVDDGTELPLPDIDSLVMPAPEPRGRRQRTGRPLRDEIEEKLPAADDQPFGDGLDVVGSDRPSVTTGDEAAVSRESGQPNAPTDQQSPKKRRPRRRPRSDARSDRGTGPVTDQADTANSAEDAGSGAVSTASTDVVQTPRSPTQSNAAGDADRTSDLSETGDGTSGPRKRRRRRRRGPRKKSDPNSGPGSEDSGPSTAAGNDS